MTNPLDTYDPEEWFAAKAKQYGLAADDLIHPSDVDPENVPTRVLVIDTFAPRHGDYTLEKVEVEDMGKGIGPQPYAYLDVRRGAIALGLDRDKYEGGSKHYRFVPDDAEFRAETKTDAVNAFRDFGVRANLRPEQSIAIAEPWGEKATETMQDYWDRHGDQFRFIESQHVMELIIDNGIPEKSSVNADEYFGRSITGHTKRAQGEYRGNLTILEEDAGMEKSYDKRPA